MLITGCGGGGGGSSPAPQAALPDFSAATFANPSVIDNPLWNFPADTSRAFASEGSDDPETIVIERLPGTRIVMGVACAMVRDRAFEDGLLIEDTEDWFAQDDAGSVWYMGESVLNYTYDVDGNLLGTDTLGSWEAGLDPLGTGTVASPGVAMPAVPAVGDFFYQEFYEGVAEDAMKILDLDAPVDLADGTALVCVKARESSALSPNSKELKYFAPGPGFVLEETPSGNERLEYRGEFVQNSTSLPSFAAAVFSAPEQIDHPNFPQPLDVARVFVSQSEDEDAEIETAVIERLPGLRTILGVDCAIVRDRVFEDGLLLEDTEDWFAQDDAGNVWYMGEFVINYDYDENGNLLGTDNDGSWEAGLDVAGVGSIAEAGHQLPAQPVTGSAYYQEFYPGEAEDMGRIAANDAPIVLPDGSAHTGCVQVLDWNPLEPDGLEYKFFAPGVGLVHEQALHEAVTLSLVGSFDQSAASIPDFASATFTLSTLVDHPFLPLPMGATWEYEAETEEGTETVEVTVLALTNTIAGVVCLDVEDLEFLDGVLMEETHDYFAQDDAGNVWYLGEDVVNYHYDANGVLIGTDTDGSWAAGLDLEGVGSLADAGLLMPAQPTAGQVYFQEHYLTVAEDMGRVVATGVTIKLPGGKKYSGCVQVLDWDRLQPDELEYKYYAPDIGLVFERALNEDEELELVDTSL